MRNKQSKSKATAERVVKGIRRKTRRQFSAEEKIRIVLEGLRGDGKSDRALAQLTPVEQQVLIGAVNGTDICESSPQIAALQSLCENRIETRSAEFSQTRDQGSAEDNLLGGGFDSERLATLEAAISRLARNSSRADNFADQAIASVTLGQQTVLTDPEATETEGDPEKELSP